MLLEFEKVVVKGIEDATGCDVFSLAQLPCRLDQLGRHIGLAQTAQHQTRK
jgi:hypothetical protein